MYSVMKEPGGGGNTPRIFGLEPLAPASYTPFTDSHLL